MRNCDHANVRLRHGEHNLLVPRKLVMELGQEKLIELKDSHFRLTSLGREHLKLLLTGRNEGHPAGGPKAGMRQRGMRTSESPLDRLYQRGKSGKAWLSETEFEAGERLRRDFEFGRLQPRVTLNWEAGAGRVGGRHSGGVAELSDFAIDARRRVERALNTLQDGLAGIALDVCCFLKGLEQVERERQWPPRSAKLMLKTALAVLAEHYGLATTDRRGYAAILHWGDGDYRPRIAPSSDTF